MYVEVSGCIVRETTVLIIYKNLLVSFAGVFSGNHLDKVSEKVFGVINVDLGGVFGFVENYESGGICRFAKYKRCLLTWNCEDRTCPLGGALSNLR